MVKPQFEIDEFITELTGISNQDLENAPSRADVLPSFKGFISSSILIGHNVNFDINFLYDAFLENMNYKMNNDYIDILNSLGLYKSYSFSKSMDKRYVVVNSNKIIGAKGCCFLTDGTATVLSASDVRER